MEASTACATLFGEHFHSLTLGDKRVTADDVKRLRRQEAVTDSIKKDLRDNLPRHLFPSVDRRELLQLVAEIARIADASEDVAVLLNIRTYAFPDPLRLCGELLVLAVKEILLSWMVTVPVTAMVSGGVFKMAVQTI